MPAKTRICPAPGCKHNRQPQPASEFPSSRKGKRYICNTCRAEAIEDDLDGRVCLICRLPIIGSHWGDNCACHSCYHHLEASDEGAWLIVSAPTDDGAVWKGRYLPDPRFRDALLDAIFDPGAIVEHYVQRVYQGAYKITGAQSLAPYEMEPQKLVVVDGHRPRGDRRIFRP